MCEEMKPGAKGFTGIKERFLVARHAAFTRMAEVSAEKNTSTLEDVKLAFDILKSCFSQLTGESMENINNLNDLLNSEFVLGVLNYNNFGEWADMQKDIDVSV